MLKVCTFEEFIHICNIENGIICIGVGNRFDALKEMPEGRIILKHVAYLADNDNNKQKTLISLGDRKLEIKSLRDINNLVIQKMVILITCYAYLEILEQIEQYESLRNLDIFCLTHMLAFRAEEKAMEKEIPFQIRLSDEPLIPKKIHYCWFGGNPLPDRYKKWMESWSKYCPDYEIIEWNEGNYDITKNRYMLQAYEQKKWGFVPDYARLDIIYNYGGIYLDTDVELIQNIDDLLYQEAFAGFESENYVCFGLGFGAIKGHPLIKELRDDYESREFINLDGSLNLVASPALQTEVLRKKGLICNGKYQKIANMMIYPEKMFSGKSIYTRRIRVKSYTRSIHHFDGSWLSEKNRKSIIKLEEDINSINLY